MNKGPDFIGIGAPRCGTTWIFENLYEHPEVYMPVKELHFFSDPYRWQKGREWYESFFLSKPKSAQSGEFSTSYICTNGVAEKIHQYYPDAKLIACFRNPVERFYSSCFFGIKMGYLKPNLSLKEIAQKNPQYLQAGLYAASIKKYLSLFPAKQIMLLIYEDIPKNPPRFIQSIYNFIGVNSSFEPSMINKKTNQSRIPKSLMAEKVLIKIFLKLELLGLHKPLRWLKKKGGEKMINMLNTKADNLYSAVNADDKKRLKEYYAKDIEELEKIINRPLLEWRT